MLYWQLRFVRQAFSCWVIFSQLLLAMTWCSVSLFLLLVREGTPEASRALRLCVAPERDFHCSQGWTSELPLIGFACCGWLSFGFVGCRLCQAAMITFPQWMAASGVLAYRAGFGSVLF